MGDLPPITPGAGPMRSRLRGIRGAPPGCEGKVERMQAEPWRNGMCNRLLRPLRLLVASDSTTSDAAPMATPAGQPRADSGG